MLYRYIIYIKNSPLFFSFFPPPTAPQSFFSLSPFWPDLKQICRLFLELIGVVVVLGGGGKNVKRGLYFYVFIVSESGI